MNDRSKLAEYHVVNATACTLCGSGNVGRFVAETAIHFQGLENINKPAVFVFPELAVCLHCGFAVFAVPQEELRTLGNGNAGEQTDCDLPLVRPGVSAGLLG
jgi:hypothetical protein